MNREYRIVTGVAYPVLFNGKNQPTQVTANLQDPSEYYYDPSIRLSEKDMASYRNRPVCVEHDQSNVIGEIANVWKGADGHMWMHARIFTDTPSGIDHFNRINNGDLSCLSVGYSVGTDNHGNVTGKDYHEISVCKEGFFPGAALRVAASGEKKYITNDSEYVKKLLFSVMASETNFGAGGAAASVAAPTPAAVAAPTAAAPLDARNKDASELARQSDSLLQQQAADAARYKTMEQELAVLRKEKAEQLAQYATKRKTDHEQAIGLLKEQWKEQHPNEEFPSEFEESAKAAFLHPEGERAAAVITANALSYKMQREEKSVLMAKYAEMEKKMKQFESDSEVAKAHVRASERLHMSTGAAPAADVPASTIVGVNASKPNMSNLFLPSVHEKQLMKDNYGIIVDESKINVHASATAVAPSSPFDEPSPQQVKFLPNSMFRQNHPGRVLAEWTRNHADKFASARLAGMFVPATEVMEK